MFFIGSLRFRTTLLAPAAHGFYDVVKVFLAIVVGNLFAGFDVFPRPDPDASAGYDCFSIWFAGVVNVTRNVTARAAVNRALSIDAKEISSFSLIDIFVWN